MSDREKGYSQVFPLPFGFQSWLGAVVFVVGLMILIWALVQAGPK